VTSKWFLCFYVLRYIKNVCTTALRTVIFPLNCERKRVKHRASVFLHRSNAIKTFLSWQLLESLACFHGSVSEGPDAKWVGGGWGILITTQKGDWGMNTVQIVGQGTQQEDRLVEDEPAPDAMTTIETRQRLKESWHLEAFTIACSVPTINWRHLVQSLQALSPPCSQAQRPTNHPPCQMWNTNQSPLQTGA